jgi:hypothetical protein
MGLSEKKRSQHASVAATLLPPDCHLHDYIVGRGHARMTGRAIGITAAFAVAAVVALQFGVVLIPGVVLIFIVFNEIRPPRGIALTDQGATVMSRTFWTGRPAKRLGSIVPVTATPSGSLSSTIEIGEERVTLSTRELARFALAVPG